MIRYVSGDLLKSGADVLVNPVNCVGVMGKGLALEFKRRYPLNFQEYEAACSRSAIRPGRMFAFETGEGVPPQIIINFPTKRHWKDGSRLEDIALGLVDLATELMSRQLRTVAVPALGCGNGGLAWSEVRSLIESELGRLITPDIYVYTPDGTVNCVGCQHFRPDPDRPVSRIGTCTALKPTAEVESGHLRYCCYYSTNSVGGERN